MKPSERIEEVYNDYLTDIMKTSFNDELRDLEIRQIHAAIAEIAVILDELAQKDKE